MVNPLIPAEGLRHGVDQVMINFLFCIFALSSLCTALLLGKLLSILGRRNIILASFGLKIFTYGGFILISSVQSKTIFTGTFILLHVTQGISASAYGTSVYSSLITMFPNHISHVISWNETFSGIGFSFGPAVGSVLFSYGGYTFPFYVFLVVLVTMTFLTTTFIPESVNQTYAGDEDKVEVSYFSLLKNTRILFA